MTDQRFEARIAQVLGAYADEVIVPIDASRIAMAARPTHTGILARLATTARTTRPSAEMRLVLVAAALLLAIVVATLLVGGGQRPRLAAVDAVPGPSSSPADGSTSVTDPLIGSWIAPNPANLVIGGSAVTEPLVFEITSRGTEASLPIGSGRERLLSKVSGSGQDELTFVTKPGAVDEVVIGGTTYRACVAGETGSYRARRSSDGLLLTLDVIEDVCPSRQAVLARTWTRYLGRPSSGGIGAVDAFDPLFAVTLPPGSYVPERAPGAMTIRQAAPELEFIAWKDPQGFNDPCDPLGKGRRPIANAADFVGYFRQLPGFTVDAVNDVQIDGRPAINIKLHANPDASCPAGWLAQWQPKELTGEPYWYLRPGDRDSLYLVDLADTTLMFEVLAGPQDLDAQIIPTIRLLPNGLPASP